MTVNTSGALQGMAWS